MELELHSHQKDLYPVCGIFIEGNQLSHWLSSLDKLSLDASSIKIYALPAQNVDQIWGCVVLADPSHLPDELGKHISALMIGDKLIVPEKSKVVPELTKHDVDQFFKDQLFVMHPEIGFYKLTEPILLSQHLDIEELKIIENLRPVDYSSVSGEIKGFSIESTAKEELKSDLESVGERKKFESKPLSIGERLRLEFYKKIMITDEKGNKKIELNKKGSALQKLAEKLGFTGPDMNDKLIEDFRNLQERNKKEVDKLMDLLEDNPEEALRFAIPLEEHGYTRGGMKGEFKMQDRGLDFSLFSGLNLNSASGGAVDLGDEYFRLRQQYLKSANALKEKGEFEKAAFIYLKLLKDYNAAAKTLREGKQYEKAALVYLDYVKNEKLAAECYEEARIYEEAIELYIKLEKQEKVGDLYVLLGSRKSANKAFQRQIDKDLEGKKYVKAAKLSKNKMLNLGYAQELLLKGWKNKIDQYNCLRHYFNNLYDTKEVWQEIERINKNDVDASNDIVFLKLLKDEFNRQDENEQQIKKLAYNILSKGLEEERISAHELLSFNRVDKTLRADTLRFDLKKNKRMKN